MRATVTRPCPTCLPNHDADFDFHRSLDDGRLVYQCRNCFHEVAVRPRPRKVGGFTQLGAVQRVRSTVDPVRFDVEVIPPDAGQVDQHIRIRAKRWFEENALAVVGVRGGLTLTVLPAGGGAVPKSCADRAWSALSSYFGCRDCGGRGVVHNLNEVPFQCKCRAAAGGAP